eukprot:1956888-Prymnesium_polylepis.1
MIFLACASSGTSCVAESLIPRQRSLIACSASARCAPQMLHGSPPRRGSAGVWKSPARTFMTAPTSDARLPLPCSPGASAIIWSTRVQYCGAPPRSRV